MVLRLLRSIMDSTTKRVPIPKNGVDYRGKVVLAPMVRSGELPCRLTALHYGADLVWGPETIDKAIIGAERKLCPVTNTLIWTRLPSNMLHKPKAEQKESIVYRIHPEKEKGKLIYQIGTANPKFAVEAAKMVAADVSGIDVNSGCPKPFSTSGGMGAALLRTPDLLCSILTSLVKEVGEVFEIGISVKIRLLETPELTRSLVERLVHTGITGLTVHCRTTPMRPRERAIREQLRMIGEICRDAGVACLMNGDVTGRDEALELAKEYGVDGGMIATAAESNPSVFRSTTEGGLAPWQEITHVYMKNALDVGNRFSNTKFSLAQLIPGKTDVGKVLYQAAKTNVKTVELLGFDDLVARAHEIDLHTGLVQNETKIGKPREENKSAQGAGKSALSMKDKPRKPLSQRGVQVAKSLISTASEEPQLIERSAAVM